jgi:hypothetical protein
VGLVYDPRELSGVTTAMPGGGLYEYDGYPYDRGGGYGYGGVVPVEPPTGG